MVKKTTSWPHSSRQSYQIGGATLETNASALLAVSLDKQMSRKRNFQAQVIALALKAYVQLKPRKVVHNHLTLSNIHVSNIYVSNFRILLQFFRNVQKKTALFVGTRSLVLSQLVLARFGTTRLSHLTHGPSHSHSESPPQCNFYLEGYFHFSSTVAKFAYSLSHT